MTKTSQIAKTRRASFADPATGAVDLTALHEATRELPTAIPLPEQAQTAWQRFPQVYGTVRVPEPGTPAWSPAETAHAGHALEIARALRDAARQIEDAVTEGYLTSLDIQAAVAAVADPALAARLEALPRNRNRHYALGQAGKPVQTPIPGTEKVLSAEYTIGKPQLSVEDLDKLREAGQISRREYKNLTRTVRVVDPEALTRATATSPSLRARLRGAFKTPTPRISVHVREAKTPVAS